MQDSPPKITAQKLNARVQVSQETEDAAALISQKINLSKPRVLGVFATAGMEAGARMLLLPFGLDLAQLQRANGRARKGGRK